MPTRCRPANGGQVSSSRNRSSTGGRPARRGGIHWDRAPGAQTIAVHRALQREGVQERSAQRKPHREAVPARHAEVDQVKAIRAVAMQDHNQLSGGFAGGRCKTWPVEKGRKGACHFWGNLIIRLVSSGRPPRKVTAAFLKTHEGKGDQHGCEDQHACRANGAPGKEIAASGPENVAKTWVITSGLTTMERPAALAISPAIRLAHCPGHGPTSDR